MNTQLIWNTYPADVYSIMNASRVMGYVKDDLGNPYERIAKALRVSMPKIMKVIYHDPATIVLWGDGTKTVVKCDPRDTYDKKIGFLLCWMKKSNELFGTRRNFNYILDEWVKEED